MEVKIDQLIEQLKKEGVEGAQKSADALLAKARKDADAIVAEAQKKSERLIADAEKKAETFENNSKLAIQQAARDGELLLKSKITALFDQVFKRSAAEAMDQAFLKDLILKIAGQSEAEEIEVTLSPEDQKKLGAGLLGELKKEVKKGITLKAGDDLVHGFHIGQKGDDVYYDFSDESIGEILKKALNPRLKEILDSHHDG